MHGMGTCAVTTTMVSYGMVWYGMAWYGMVWYGMEWCGRTEAACFHFSNNMSRVFGTCNRGTPPHAHPRLSLAATLSERPTLMY